MQNRSHCNLCTVDSIQNYDIRVKHMYSFGVLWLHKITKNAANSMFPCLVYFSVLYRCTNPLHTRQHVASNICICNHSTPQECALPYIIIMNIWLYINFIWLCFFCLFVFYYIGIDSKLTKPSTFILR